MEKKFKIIKSVVAFLTISLTILAPLSFMTPTAKAALVPGGAVGPVVPAGLGKGFPAWYMDQNGLAIDLMEAADGFGISDPVDPANAFSQELGFNAEGFYWSAEALPANPNGPVGIIVLALEAAFAGESAVDGEQSVFGRIRIRFDVGEPGTYTVRHPFGTNTYVIDTVLPGAPEINDSSDIGCFAIAGVLSCDPNSPPGNANNFGLALQSGIGPFLTWDTFDLDPALSDPLLVNPARPGKRYVGNPIQEHAIKGSPVGQNFFRVEGPNVGGPGINFIQTNLFTVTGRIAVIDTVAPVVASVTPAEVIVGADGAAPTVTVAANITDALNAAGDPGAVRSATIDLSALANNFSATLNAAQEVPGPGNSGGSGSGTFVLDRVANTLSFNISFTGLSAGDREATPHIHNAAAGTNGPAIFDLPLGASKVGTWNYPENLEAEILAGRMYVQIHSELFPAGAIRGQMLAVPDIQNMVLTAGTPVNGTWSFIVRSLPGVGTFSLPISTNDGANITNFAYSLAVTNPPPVANPDTATIGTNIGESATIAVLSNDTDPNGNLPLSLVSVQNVSAGTGVISGSDVIITSPTDVFAGVITAQYTVADSLGATSNGDITVNVVRDVTAPAIAILGDNPISIRLGGTYTDAGATALDDFDGDVTANIVTTGLPVDTSTAGAKTVTYTVTDLVGNSGSLSRTVNVEAPVLTTVTVTPANLTVPLSGNRQMTAEGFDQFGITMAPQPALTWTSANAGVAAVSPTGLVFGAGLGGPVVITASAGLVQGTANATVVSGPVCDTTADTDLSGSISNLEILNHVRAWKNGTVPNLEILNAIRFWKTGTGC